MKIYIDADYKCHVEDGGGMTAIETNFFEGKCSEFIEGHRFVPQGIKWLREDGAEFKGEMICAWKPFQLLDDAQREHDRKQMADMAAALNELGVYV